MELHWQNLSENERILILCPGTWLFYKEDKSASDYIYISLILFSSFNTIKLVDFGGISNINKIKERYEYCIKYASIIASSYHTQQHPYRDYLKNQ